jgi:hypothetical protein
MSRSTACHPPEAHLWPREGVTLGGLHALTGMGNRACHRWLSRASRPWFRGLLERTRLFRLFTTPQDWPQAFLAAPTVLGVIDPEGIVRIPDQGSCWIPGSYTPCPRRKHLL